MKLWRGIMSTITEESPLFPKIKSRFVEWVSGNEESLTGKQWLNILEMTRYAGQNAFEEALTNHWRANYDAMLQGNSLSLQSLALLKTNMGRSRDQLSSD